MYNNPFAPAPGSAQSRFPDISAGSPDNSQQFTQWMSPQGAQSLIGFPPQSQPGPYGGAPQAFQPGMMSPGMQSPAPMGSGFQPTSAFGQQLASGQVSGTGSSYGYLYGQGAAPAPAPYNPVQQQLQSTQHIVNQFDPYAGLGQLVAAQQAPQPQQPPPLAPTPSFQSVASSSSLIPTSPSTTTSTSPSGQLHPREYIKINKLGVESWDSATWSHLLGAFEALSSAWNARKQDILSNVANLQQQLPYAYAYAPGQLQQEIARLQTMAKEAESNHDSVAASSFQMREVFENYRSTSNVATKSRVREASNAALASLPDWPPLAY
uniref:Nucleoporin NSP1-like C-terminal domain-containing protein n=1 Tax=Mycena chlorophos TaxID=658473 RepID=A0ABQ0MEW1_MYCCL|nr:predicted protein [Mycena chlorophos]